MGARVNVACKEFYERPVSYAPSLVIVTVMFGGMGLGFGQSEGLMGSVIGAVFFGMLVAVYWLVFQWLKRPAVRIVGEEIEVRGSLRRVYKIDDIREYSLVLSRDYIGLRRSDSGDIMIERSRFADSTWKDMKLTLRQLPFARIVL